MSPQNYQKRSPILGELSGSHLSIGKNQETGDGLACRPRTPILMALTIMAFKSKYLQNNHYSESNDKPLTHGNQGVTYDVRDWLSGSARTIRC
jgi:hypothetical protein